MDTDKPAAGDPAPRLLVRLQGSDWSLPAGPAAARGLYPQVAWRP